MAGNLQILIFTDQSDGESARKTEEMCENFLNFTYLHKTQPEQKTAGNFPNFLKISTHQMFGHPDLDAGLNTSQFGGDITFSDR